MATASDAARARDDAEAEAVTLYDKAVAYVASKAALASGDAEDATDDSLVTAAGVALALALILSLRRRNGRDVPAERLDIDPEALADEIGPQLAETAVKQATEHLTTVSGRVTKKNPDATRSEQRAAFTDDTAWIRAAGRTAATRAASETVIDMAPMIDDAVGERHELLWVSRGDHKVRSSHRRLHGKVRKFGKSFKPPLMLRYPGDPAAPLGETINCRCALLLVPAKEARKAMDIFAVGEEQWDAIDSLRASVGWVADEADMLRAQADLVAEITHSTL